MIDKEKFAIFKSMIFCLFGIFVSFFFIKNVFPFFHSEAHGLIANKVAFYVIDPRPQTEEIKIGELQPDGQNFSYDIDVSNYKNSKISEVDMNYTMEIVTTTNIPVTYYLYKNHNTSTNIIGTKEIIRDDDGMYFFKFSPQVGSFVHGVSKTDTYTLVINFPVSYNSSYYQDLIDTIKVTINAVQV